MSMRQFLKRLDSMITALEILKEGGTSCAVEELNAQIISKASPGSISIDFLKQGADSLTTKDETKDALRRLEKDDALIQKIRTGKDKVSFTRNRGRNGRGSKEEGEDKQKHKKQKEDDKKPSFKCRLPNHERIWEDCPNIPIGKKRKGAHYREI